MIAKKRGNLENPALSYLSGTQESEQATAGQGFFSEVPQTTTAQPIRQTVTEHSTNYKEMLKQVEARSKRLQCLIQPSLFNKVKAIADRRGVSFNDIVHTTLEELAENEGH